MTTSRLALALRHSFARGFLMGAGVTLGAMVLVPAVRRSMRPLLVGAVRGAFDVADEVRTQAALLQENLEDLMAEAEYEHKQILEQAAAQAQETLTSAAGEAGVETDVAPSPLKN